MLAKSDHQCLFFDIQYRHTDDRLCLGPIRAS